MTADKFIKIRRLIMIIGASVGSIAGVVLSVYVAMSPVARNIPLGILILVLVLVYLLAMLLATLASWGVKREFEENHPEMKEINLWVKVAGSTHGYPTSQVSMAAYYALEALTELERRGKAANVAIEIRNYVSSLAEKNYKIGTPEMISADAVVRTLADIAENNNQRYLGYWNLVVDRKRILRGDNFQLPQLFRERLRSQ